MLLIMGQDVDNKGLMGEMGHMMVSPHMKLTLHLFHLTWDKLNVVMFEEEVQRVVAHSCLD